MGSAKWRQSGYAADECVYPAIRAWMHEHGYNFSELARMTGLCNQTVSRALRGRDGVTKYTIDQLLAVTGMTYENAFSVDFSEGG